MCDDPAPLRIVLSGWRHGNRRGGRAVSPLAFLRGVPGSIPGQTMPLVGGFSRNIPLPPPFHSDAAPYSPQSPQSALKASLLRCKLEDNHEKRRGIETRNHGTSHNHETYRAGSAFPCDACRGVIVVSLLASHQGESGSIPGGVASGFSHVGILPNDTGWWVFKEISRFPRPCFPTLLHTHFASPSSAIKTSLVLALLAAAVRIVQVVRPSATAMPLPALGANKH
ncbi:hypothetical protein PR048_015062 [Dryococelus australis]|uniref:Uncharacterized protein n=1 Tax=Dryococelus australis TaxID=614101 RepID=A0ABQ9HG63_9NEOP|nr:hypothetical protein PR048_015062 [Dryococelus australis]